jgi:FKBP-type peptidyl-prolyl cis-trans isomerase
MKFSAAFLAVSVLAWPLTASAAMAPGAATADPGLSQEANAAFLAANAKKAGVIIRPDGLQFRIVQNGFGKRPTVTDSVEVYYTGALINGRVFDGTSPGLPASFKVNQVIPGWTEALQLMREGDHWQLVIPSALAYGPRGAGNAIPPDQVLVFDMTLVSTTPAPKRGEPGYIPDPNDPLDKDK